MSFLAIDCDLNAIYAWSNTHGIQCNAACFGFGVKQTLAYVERDPTALVLLEIASPVDYAETPGAAYHKRRWTIFNIAFAATLSIHLKDKLLVSPSSKWTGGHPLVIRHRLAKATAPNKDLRECEAMIWSYKHNREAWGSFADFLDGVSVRKQRRIYGRKSRPEAPGDDQSSPVPPTPDPPSRSE